MAVYEVRLTRQARKDLNELKRSGSGDKADAMLRLLSEDPFRPPWKELSGEYRGFYFRRLNRTDRVVYTIRNEDDRDIVIVVRMRTHYRGMFSLLI